MVLKVVVGKILETLELRRFLAGSGSVFGNSGRPGSAQEVPRDVFVIRMSKIEYYPVDNIYVFILSLVMGWVQEERGWWRGDSRIGTTAADAKISSRRMRSKN
jgi:hypothetical protein